MILTCPACGTRYTVKDGAIPPGGRQVRCANCKHSWHQDPDPATAGEAAVAPPADGPEASDTPAPAEDVHPAGEDGGKPAEAALSDHAHPDVADDGTGADDDDASPLPGPQATPVEDGWRTPSPVEAEPQTITPAEPDEPDEVDANDAEPIPYAVAHDPGLATPALPAGEEAGWIARPSTPADLDFAAYDSGHDEFSGGRGKLLIGLLAALVIIAIAVAAFWFLAPASFKERLGLAQATDTPLLIQVDQRNRRTLASGNQLLEVSGKVINPTDQTRQVPPLQAQLRSLDQQVVYRWTIPPPAQSLQPGGSASFNSAELNIPPAAACLDVSFDKARAPAAPCKASDDGVTRTG